MVLYSTSQFFMVLYGTSKFFMDLYSHGEGGSSIVKVSGDVPPARVCFFKPSSLAKGTLFANFSPFSLAKGILFARGGGGGNSTYYVMMGTCHFARKIGIHNSVNSGGF